MSEQPAQGYVSRLRAELGARGVSQTQIAGLLGKSQQSVSRRMNGETALTVDELVTLCGAYAIDPMGVLQAERPAERTPSRRHLRLWKPSSMTNELTGRLGYAG